MAKLKLLLNTVHTLGNRWDGQATVPSFETPNLLKEVRDARGRIGEVLKEVAMMNMQNANTMGGSGQNLNQNSMMNQIGGPSTVTNPIGHNLQPLIKTLEDEKYAADEVIRELRTKISLLEDENLSLSRQQRAGDDTLRVATDTGAKKIQSLEQANRSVLERLVSFHGEVGKVVRSNQDNLQVVLRSLTTSSY